MIKFKQKDFAWPLLAAAIPAVVGAAGQMGSTAIGNKAAKTSSEATVTAAKIQASIDNKRLKQQQKEAEMNKKLVEKQVKAAEIQGNKIMKIAKKNPEAAAAIQPTATISVTPSQQQAQPQQNMYSILNENTVGLLSAGLGASSAIVPAAMGASAQKAEAKANVKMAQAANQRASLEYNLAKDKNQKDYELKKMELKNKKREFKTSIKKASASVPTTSQSQPKQVQYSDKNTKKEIIGLAKNIKQLAADRGVKRGIVSTAVGGATAVGAKYLVDKAIQRDIKKSGLEKVNDETPEQKAARKKSRRRTILLGVGTAATTVGAGIAAKKGAFGKDAKNWANTNLTKDKLKNRAISTKNTIKQGFLDQYTEVDKETGKRSVNKIGVLLPVAGVAMPAVKYALTKKAYKNQIKQSEGNEEQPEDRNYSKISSNTSKSLNKVVGNLAKAKGSKVGATNKAQSGKIGEEIKKALNGFFKKGTKSKSKSDRSQTILDNRRRIEHFKSGIRNNNQTSSNTSNSENTEGGLFTRFKNNVKTGFKEFKEAPGQFVLGRISEKKGGGGRKGVAKFGEDLENLGKENNNVLSQKIGEKIKENPKTALLGSIGVGLGVAKLGGLGERTAQKAIRAVDKNAFAYQERGTTFAPRGQQSVKYQQELEEDDEGEN